MNSNLELLREQLRERVAADPDLSRLGLLDIAKPSVDLSTRQVRLAELSLGESRIGGIPDLPPDVDWPRWQPSKPRNDTCGRRWHPEQPAPLGFIAQIDLATIPRIDSALPESGWLYFFYDRYCEPWGYDPDDRGCCRVIYVDCDRAALERSNPPPDANMKHIAAPCRVEARTELTLPDELPGIEYGTTSDEAYQDLREELTDGGHHLLGYPQIIQNPMELECQLASNGIDCGTSEGYQSTQAKALSEGAHEWQLLLQIDSDEGGPGWMWGDAGRIYFWIRRDDLASLHFDDVWLILQCF